MVFSSRGFKSISGQVFITTSKNYSETKTICISLFGYIYVITSTRLQLMWLGWLIKAMVEMKFEY